MRYILSIIFLILSGRLLSQPQNSLFLIPKGYQGLIFVFYERPHADSLPIENGNRIHKIPNDGVLLTSSKEDIDSSSAFFYYVDSLGAKLELNFKCNEKPEIPCTTSFAIKGGIYNFKRSERDKHPLKFSEFSLLEKASKRSILTNKYYSQKEKYISKKLSRPFVFNLKY